jgi:hypothetical protein
VSTEPKRREGWPARRAQRRHDRRTHEERHDGPIVVLREPDATNSGRVWNAVGMQIAAQHIDAAAALQALSINADRYSLTLDQLADCVIMRTVPAADIA